VKFTKKYKKWQRKKQNLQKKKKKPLKSPKFTQIPKNNREVFWGLKLLP